MRSYIVLAIESGIRRGELAALEWDRVDLKRRTATLHDTKNGSGRHVPLSSLVGTLAKMVRPIEGGRIFPQHADNISKAFAATCRRAGVSGLRLHDLRAECVSRLFERGLDLNSGESDQRAQERGLPALRPRGGRRSSCFKARLVRMPGHNIVRGVLLAFAPSGMPQV
jgi:integrase